MHHHCRITVASGTTIILWPPPSPNPSDMRMGLIAGSMPFQQQMTSSFLFQHRLIQNVEAHSFERWPFVSSYEGSKFQSLDHPESIIDSKLEVQIFPEQGTIHIRLSWNVWGGEEGPPNFHFIAYISRDEEQNLQCCLAHIKTWMNLKVKA